LPSAPLTGTTLSTNRVPISGFAFQATSSLIQSKNDSVLPSATSNNNDDETTEEIHLAKTGRNLSSNRLKAKRIDDT
jgi:hypothetical protein